MRTKDAPLSDEIKSRAVGPPMNQNQQIIQIKLSIIQRRIRVQSIFTQLARYVFWGLLLTSGMILLSRFVRLPNIPSAVVLIPIILSAILAIGSGIVRKVSPSAVARFVDKQLNLKERFSTAVELMQRKVTDDLSRLQIRDTATTCTKIFPSAVAPYRFPSVLKWFPIPVLLLLVSFAVPRMYKLPLAPTAAEQKAIEETVENFNRMMGQIDDPVLAKKIQDVVKGLDRAEIHTVHNRLSKLRDEVRARKQPYNESEIEEVSKAIAEVSEEFNRSKNMDPGKLAEELEKLANEEDLTPELQEELLALFNKIAERLGDNSVAKNLTNELDQLQTQTVSPDTLKNIARQLANMDKLARSHEQLERVLDQIAARRKNIALASLEIEMDRRSGGIANSDGSAGDESTIAETLGTVAAADPEFVPDSTAEEAEFETQSMANETSQSLRTDGPELTLRGSSSNPETLADTNVYIGNDAPSGEDEPEYLSYRSAVLNAKQDYTEAVESNRIPVRYQQLISDYLDAITSP